MWYDLIWHNMIFYHIINKYNKDNNNNNNKNSSNSNNNNNR